MVSYRSICSGAAIMLGKEGTQVGGNSGILVALAKDKVGIADDGVACVRVDEDRYPLARIGAICSDTRRSHATNSDHAIG